MKLLGTLFSTPLPVLGLDSEGQWYDHRWPCKSQHDQHCMLGVPVCIAHLIKLLCSRVYRNHIVHKPHSEPPAKYNHNGGL